MRTVAISDITLKERAPGSLTFREKLELVKLLDRLQVDYIELGELAGTRADLLCAKSIAQTVRFSGVTVTVGLDESEADRAWEALKFAQKPRIQIACPVSVSQMEYLYHLKQSALKDKVANAVSYAKTLCGNVEFLALDAARAEGDFLAGILTAAVEAGAETITLCDSVGSMLPGETESWLNGISRQLSNLSPFTLGFSCSNDFYLSHINLLSAVACGAGEVKTASYPGGTAAVGEFVKIISAREDTMQAALNIRTVELKRILGQIEKLLGETKSKTSPFEDGVSTREEKSYTVNDSREVISQEIARLGYELSEEDNALVYEAFLRIAARKESVSSTEIDAIVASSAMQVPPTYTIEDYIINSGSTIGATSHIRLSKQGKRLESVSIGDGSVDASFLAIEQITGHHYELDDFQIRAVTEGHEAMGETVVKLRADNGKLYSGRGLSTDIVASSIRAYVSALNKIAYEEDNR